MDDEMLQYKINHTVLIKRSRYVCYMFISFDRNMCNKSRIFIHLKYPVHPQQKPFSARNLGWVTNNLVIVLYNTS